MDKFNHLRNTYGKLIYHSFTVAENKISYHFSLDDEFHFRPEWTFNVPQNGMNIDLLAFNLGMAELVSYWKCACPKIVEVRCGSLSDWQKNWWKKLYRNGLGEFFYCNKIEPDADFMRIDSLGAGLQLPQTRELSGCLIPVGGGKDSVVTLELLRERRDANLCYIIGDIKSAVDTAKTAGYADSQILKVSRSIDPALLELNRRGFLNGHTPFSAVVAFSGVLFAYLAGKKYVVLSNESSANEGNVSLIGPGVNHQYSKSLEFERDFREYIAQLSGNLPEYFSFLRPMNELRITEIFFHNSQYFPVFKSCNAGAKTNTWCCKCAKCLYIYVMLAAFLGDDVLVGIFGENLLEKQELGDLLTALANPDYDKPFECVGTRDEVNFALHKALLRRENPPKLLRDYAPRIKPVDSAIISRFDTDNFVPDEFFHIIAPYEHN
ncbi:MAG: hypothetical protein FWH20_07675 [Oscillospiraceae bacterium]|nr:hypothetical protein [Oscillospiraceae bacterium]